MNKLSSTLIIIILFSVLVYADSLTSVHPSVFYTHGSYSNSFRSNSIAAYANLRLAEKHSLILGYDNLLIDAQDWKYRQQTFVGGTIINLFPLFAKFNYGYIKGDFNLKGVRFSSSDYSNLYNLDLFYYLDEFYFGGAAAYLTQKGYKEQQAGQFTLRIEKYLGYNWYIALRPNLSILSDGRNLYSASLKVHYMILPEVLLKAGGFGGERAYYFDSDLLTIFNQDETQKYQLFGQAELFYIPSVDIVLSYQHTAFSNYSINYLVAGIRTHINF